MDLQIGCMNRPWGKFELGETLEGIAAAGYPRVEFCAQQGVHLIRPDSTDEELGTLREQLDGAGLEFDMISTGPDFGLPVAEAVAWYGKLIPNIAAMGGTWLMSCGVMDEALYDTWYEVIGEACDFAAEHDIQMCLKPHGGIGATSAGLRACMARVGKPNFSISYDPGNIRYYTGEPPEPDLPNIVEHVTSMCVKDILGGKQGQVMITPGTGEVDFVAVFTTLRDAGFDGPVWVECVGGETLDEINAEAVKTKAFLDELLAKV